MPRYRSSSRGATSIFTSFHIHTKAYASPRLGGPHVDINARHVALVALRLYRGERLTYVSNFIDHWECELRLEAMLP
jgi:hypothetical protein